MNPRVFWWVVILAILVVVTALVIVGLAVLSTINADLYSAAFVVAVGGAIFYVYKSFYFPGADEGLEVYLPAGVFWKTYHSPTFRDSLNEWQQRDRYDVLSDRSKGILDTGMVFAPWLFVKVVRFLTAGAKVMLHANKVFTKEEGVRRRTVLDSDPTMQIRFLTLRHVIPAMEVLTKWWGWYIDLREECQIEIPVHNEKYTSSRLAKIVWSHSLELILEALRKAASHFTWEGTEDIITRKPALEMAFLWTAAEGGSILSEARILQRPCDENGDELSLQECIARFNNGEGPLTLSDFFGEDTLAVDLNLEGLDFARHAEGESEASRAVNVPFIASRERIRLAEEGEGRAAAAAAIKTGLGVDGDTAYALEQLGKKEGNLNVFGGSIVEMLKALASTLKKP